MRRIALLSLHDDNFKDIARVTARNKFEYCARHDYSLHLLTHPLTLGLPTFSKPWLVEAVLVLHDWVVWMDSDTLIMNFNRKLEDYLDDSFSLIIGEDWNGINAGVFFMKNCAWSLEFLRKVKSVPRDGLPYFDQSQMAQVIAEDPASSGHVKVIPLKQCGGSGDFNCYPTENAHFPREEIFQYFDHGDFVAHFVGSQYGGEQHRIFMTDLIEAYSREVIR